jgi:hypothetical protein
MRRPALDEHGVAIRPADDRAAALPPLVEAVDGLSASPSG